MIRKVFDFPLCTLFFAISFPLHAQQQRTIPKIGWQGVRPGVSDPAPERFRRELRPLGYVERENIKIEYRSANDKLDRLPALADELVRLKVDVLFASLTPAAVAAKNATRTIPIVFSGGFDPAHLAWSIALHGLAGTSRVHQHYADVGWQTIGVTEGNCSQALPARGAVGSIESRLCPTVERKPTAGARAESKTISH